MSAPTRAGLRFCCSRILMLPQVPMPYSLPFFATINFTDEARWTTNTQWPSALFSIVRRAERRNNTAAPRRTSP